MKRIVGFTLIAVAAGLMCLSDYINRPTKKQDSPMKKKQNIYAALLALAGAISCICGRASSGDAYLISGCLLISAAMILDASRETIINLNFPTLQKGDLRAVRTKAPEDMSMPEIAAVIAERDQLKALVEHLQHPVKPQSAA